MAIGSYWHISFFNGRKKGCRWGNGLGEGANLNLRHEARGFSGGQFHLSTIPSEIKGNKEKNPKATIFQCNRLGYAIHFRGIAQV